MASGRPPDPWGAKHRSNPPLGVLKTRRLRSKPSGQTQVRQAPRGERNNCRPAALVFEGRFHFIAELNDNLQGDSQMLLKRRLRPPPSGAACAACVDGWEQEHEETRISQRLRQRTGGHRP